MDTGGHISKGSAQVHCQFLTKFLGTVGAAVVIGLVPLNICLVDRTRSDC